MTMETGKKTRTITLADGRKCEVQSLNLNDFVFFAESVARKRLDVVMDRHRERVQETLEELARSMGLNPERKPDEMLMIRLRLQLADETLISAQATDQLGVGVTSIIDFERSLRSIEGIRFLLWQSVKKSDPTVTIEEIGEAAALDELQEISDALSKVSLSGLEIPPVLTEEEAGGDGDPQSGSDGDGK